MFCKNNSSFQHVTMMQTWNIRHTVVVLYKFFIRLRYFSIVFFCVNMDVFDCCAHVSCMKQHSKNTALKLKSSCMFDLFHCPRRMFVNTKVHSVWMALSDIFMVQRVTCGDMRLDQSFLFNVIIGILSKCLILTFGNISIQNCDSLI